MRARGASCNFLLLSKQPSPICFACWRCSSYCSCRLFLCIFSHLSCAWPHLRIRLLSYYITCYFVVTYVTFSNQLLLFVQVLRGNRRGFSVVSFSHILLIWAVFELNLVTVTFTSALLVHNRSILVLHVALYASNDSKYCAYQIAGLLPERVALTVYVY